MKIYCRLLGVLFLMGWSFLLPAQSSIPHTLLWRISGKEGHKTSYLYGTMHLTDERVFRLGDSLYEAIRNSDGFAMELDPSAMIAYTMDEIKRQIVESKNVRDVLPEKDYKKYAPLLEKKFKKSPDQITSGDILREKNKWMTDNYKTGKMTTFLDIWLYDLARRQRKWTGGVEDLADQIGPHDNMVDPSDIKEMLAEDTTRSGSSRTLLDEMINLYQQQDIEGIENMVGTYGMADTVLLRRNRKMAFRMDSLSSVRSMVFAVGAAHLAGEGGLISLLRSRGFDVQPVFSSRKIAASSVKIPDLPVAWNEVRDENGYYKTSMPGIPSDIQLYGMLDMKMYFDMFDGLGFFTMAVHSAFKQEKTDSLFDVMAKRVFQMKNVKDYSPYTLNGGKGRMYTVRDKENGLRKGFVLERKGIFYMALAIAMKADSLNEGQVDHFLRSFALLEVQDAPSNSSYVLTDPSLGFRIETPVKVNKFKEPSTAAADPDSRMFMGIDEKEGVYYLFGVNRIGKGRYVDNDSSFLIKLEKSLAPKLSSITHDTSFLFKGRRAVEYEGLMKGADMMMKTRYINRGNRWYAMVVMYPSSGLADKAAHYFNSFSMLDYPVHPWRSSFSPDSLFSTWGPSPLVIAPADSSLATVDRKYDSPDTITENSYSVIAYHLSPYVWAGSDSAFWAQRLAGHISFRDSIVYKKKVSNGDAKGWEWIEYTTNSLIYQRVRLLLYGDELYSLFVSTPREEIQSPDVNRFFEDFRFNRPIPETHVFQSKADRLLKDLFSSDSVQAAAADENLNQASFTREDLPLLHRSLLQAPPFSNHLYGHEWISQSLTRTVVSLKDTSSFSFAATHYLSAPDSPYVIKDDLLTVLASFHTDSCYQVLARLLQTARPHQEFSYVLLNKLKDSLLLTSSRIMPVLLPMLADSILRPSVISVAGSLIDSGLLTRQQLQPYAKYILQAVALLVRPHGKENPYEFVTSDLISALDLLKSEPARAMLQKMLLQKELHGKIQIIKALLADHQPVPLSVCTKLAADKETRADLYKALHTAGRTDLFPPVYRERKWMGESLVYNTFIEEYDEDEPASITFLSSKTYTTPKGKKVVFFYKVTGDERSYLAVAGPYDTDPSHLDLPGVNAVVDWEEDYSLSRMDALADQLFKSDNQ